MKYSLLMIPALCITLTSAAFAADEKAPAKPETPAPAPASTNASASATTPRQRQGQQAQRDGQQAPRELPSVDSIVERHFTFAKKDKAKLTLEEYLAARAQEAERAKERQGDSFNSENFNNRLTADFKRYDKGNKGFITKEELKAGIEADRASRQRPQGDRPQRPQGDRPQRQGGGDRPQRDRGTN